jgi:cytochrome c-type biogenesis protein CcmF
MRLVGQICLLGAFIGTGYAAFACVLGWRDNQQAIRRSGSVAAVASLIALSVTAAALAYGLLAKDFRFAYVAQYSNRLLPWQYSISSFWVGQAGSLLLWTWFSAVLAMAFRFWPRRDRSAIREPAFGVLMGFCCFLLAVMVFAADPMAPSLAPPEDGAGLSPILQHPAMLIHPPIVFLGYSAWAIPFALAITALATGRLNSAWTQDARPWALFAWIVLGSGILVGALWAYEELGWGGYWGWDPVENGSLIPWLIGTTAIHTLMAWRHRGILKKSAVALTIATFGMCNFATFLTRSGIFSSLHAFSQSPIGWLFLGLMLMLVLCAGILIALRRANLTPANSVATLWCRESMVIVNTLALLALAVVTCVGTLSTAISEAVIGRKIVVGVEFYNNALIPVGLIVLLTSGLAPLLQWGVSPTRSQKKMLWVSTGVGSTASVASFLSGVRHPLWLVVCGLFAFAIAALLSALYLDARRFTAGLWFGLVRSLQTRRQQYAGFVIHMGFFCLALGVTASSLGSQRHEAIMHEGETLEWAGRQVRLAKIVQRQLPDKLVAEAILEVHQGSNQPETLAPSQQFHALQDEWTTEVAIQSTWGSDFYAILHSGEGLGRVRLTFVENPLMRCIWAGGWIMGFGSLAALWPAKRRAADQPAKNGKRSATGHEPRRAFAESVSSTSAFATLD